MTETLDAPAFSALLEQLYKIMNLLLKINHAVNAKEEKPESGIKKLQHRFSQQYQDEKNKALYADCIQAFARDAVLLQVLNEDEFELWITSLPKVLNALSCSVETFKQCIDSEGERRLKKCFSGIADADLDSL